MQPSSANRNPQAALRICFTFMHINRKDKSGLVNSSIQFHVKEEKEEHIDGRTACL